MKSSRINFNLVSGYHQGTYLNQNVNLNSNLKHLERKSKYGTYTDSFLETSARIQTVLQDNPEYVIEEFEVKMDKEQAKNLILDPNQFSGQIYLPGLAEITPVTQSNFSEIHHQQIFGVYAGRDYHEIEKGRYESNTTKEFFYYPNTNLVRVEELNDSMSYYPGKRRQYYFNNSMNAVDQFIPNQVLLKIQELKAELK